MTEKDTRPVDETEDSSSYSLKDMLMMAVTNWKWFVLALAICLGIAVYKIYSTPKVYVRQAAILIKDSRRGNVTSALFSDMTSARVVPNVANEMYLLGSQRLMTEVVGELELDVWYTHKDGLRRNDLYGISPIEVTFLDSDNKRTLSFKAELRPDRTAELSEFQAQGRKDIDKAAKVVCPLGDTVSTPIGRIVITPTLYYGRYENREQITVKKTGIELTAIYFMGKVGVNVTSRDASIISISIADVSTRRAEAVLNTLMKVYQDDVIFDKRQVADVSRRFLDERLRVIEGELADEDSKVLDFKESNRMVDFQGQNTLVLSEGSRYREEIFGIQNQIALVTYLQDFLQGETEVRLIPANVGISDQYLTALISDYNNEVLHRDELLRNSNERNPTIVSMNSALSAKFEGIMASISNLLRQLDIQLEQARTKERLALGTMSSVPGQENEMIAITRQQTVKEQLYLYLLNKKEESDLNSVAIDSDARIVEYAFGSPNPVSPKPIFILIIALFMAAAIPFCVLFGINALNTTVRGRKDVESRISVPFFGEIPFTTHKKGESDNIIVKIDGRDPVSEAFRVLRSNMNFMNVNGDMRVLIVTSTNVGSGKTFFSLNMAATLAMTGKKVVIIDGDMRKRTITGKFGNLDSSKGLSLYLSDHTTTALPLVIKNPIGGNVDMLFAGLQPPNPAELLMTHRLEELIEELKERYDYILIDSVPAFQIADAAITGRVADHTAYLIREGLMDRRQLDDIEKLYRDGRFNNMMIVLNGIRESSRKYTYGYGYGYGYGSYGYGEDKKKGAFAKLGIKRNKRK